MSADGSWFSGRSPAASDISQSSMTPLARIAQRISAGTVKFTSKVTGGRVAISREATRPRADLPVEQAAGDLPLVGDLLQLDVSPGAGDVDDRPVAGDLRLVDLAVLEHGADRLGQLRVDLDDGLLACRGPDRLDDRRV